MNITPIKRNLLTAVMYVFKVFILILVITLFIIFPLMANTNIMTGYTYIPVFVFLQVLPGLKYSVWRYSTKHKDILTEILE